MVFRKPYAFLIKNFKKIHILLLLISLYVVYKLIDVSSFINEFVNYGVYDVFQDPITKHITFMLRFSTLLLLAGSLALLILLRYKNKPWKIYLIPVIEYFALFIVLGIISNFFGGFSRGLESTDLRLSRDLLLMLSLGQILAISVFVLRVIGLDIKKFNFNSDEEFLELSEEDREEFEININFDINSFKRLFRKTIRNIKYFYMEHKKICQGIFVFLILFASFQIYHSFFVTHKTYSEGSLYEVNGYTIEVHNSYFTDKDYTGNVISDSSDFVVTDLTVTNNSAPRKLKIDNFHLKHGTNDYTTTRTTYSKEFQDFGDTYDSVKEFQRDEKLRFIIVFKVPKDLDYKKFNLFYQEADYLRKIKLDVKDYREIIDEGKIAFGDDMKFSLRRKEESISFDYYEFFDNVKYSIKNCNVNSCDIEEKNYTAPLENTVLRIDFSSINFVGKDMVDFSNDYGKIVYIDNNNGENEEVSIDYKYPFGKTATGKYLYALLPKEVENTSRLEFIYTIRNKRYIYKIIGD